MSSDISRQRFNPAKDFSSVLMQQGRVQLDADWNEWNEILDRRWRSETIDIIGRGVVPRETQNGFEIQVSGGMLTIGRGRIYVDGLQAENHGRGAQEFDPVLGETRGVNPIPYDKQPYFPDPTPLPEAGGPHLVYLDVWQREVTAIEDPGLREIALGGPDTTTRLQTAWQVRVLSDVGGSATCSTPDGQLKGWLGVIQPSGGRLTTAAVGVATEDNPCLVPPSGGYRGLDNRTYRVEIHEAGAAGGATFKWSRDNASVATNISRIEGNTLLTVDRAVWDSARRFSPGQWVEITDDWRELSGAPGEIRRIATVVDANRTITLDAPLTAGLFPVNGHLTDPARHTRIKRWDQVGVAIPPAGTSLILEDGVQVTFTVAGGGKFRAGDYWVFVARTADASVEILDEAPPRGVHHHYCRLAIVTFPNTVIDCREFWPPPFGQEGESCDCTICVTADEHNQETFTIYEAVNQIRATGGTICLGPGTFILGRGPVRLEGAFAVRIRGQGAATVLIKPPEDAAFILENARWCTLDYLTILTLAEADPGSAIRLRNCLGTTIERLQINASRQGVGPRVGVLFEPGFLMLTRIRENFIRTRFGVLFAPVSDTIGFAPGQKDTLALFGFCCEDNALGCPESGVRLGGSSYYSGHTAIARNFIHGTRVAAISVTGSAVTEMDITGNTITPANGDGIVLGSGGVRISGNEIVNLDQRADNGIRLVPGLAGFALRTVLISENRLHGLGGNGISFETLIVSAKVERNMLSAIGGSGLVMAEGSAVFGLSVLGNELINVANADSGGAGGEIAGIHLQNVYAGVVSHNVLSGIGTKATSTEIIAGVRVDGCLDLRISDNSIVNIASQINFKNLGAGVLVLGPLVNVQVIDNTIRRQLSTATRSDDADWQAIRILGIATEGILDLRFARFANLSAPQRLNLIDHFAAASARNVEDVGIHGNVLSGYGSTPLVAVSVTGSCRFSDNQCTLDRQRIAVVLAAASIIASANRVDCGPEAQAMVLMLGNDRNAFTVLGNIVGGKIQVNNNPLGLPWKPLNVGP